MKSVYLKNFTIQYWKKYLFVILLVLVQCFLFRNLTEQWMLANTLDYKPALGDYVLEFFKGTLPYTMSGQKESFNVPPILSLYLIYYFILIGKAVADAHTPFQLQCTLRRGSRTRWWRYQNLVIWRETAMYFLTTAFAFLLYALCFGTRLAGYTPDFQLAFNGMNMTGFSVFRNLVLTGLLVLPAIAYIQYIVSLMGNALIGIIVSTVIWVCSVFHWNPFLPGNYLMVKRCELILNDGFGYLTGMLFSIFLIVLMHLIGKRISKKTDLF